MNISSYLENYTSYLTNFIKAVGKTYIVNETIVQKIYQIKDEESIKEWRISNLEIRHIDFNKIHNIRPKHTKFDSVFIDVTWGIKNGEFYSNCTFKITGDCTSVNWPRNPVNAFHFDSDDGSTNDTPSVFAHPEYHIQFGGKHIRTLEEGLDSEDLDKMYGQILLLDTPRVSHPPLDVILCIDFVLTYLLPTSTTSSLRIKQEYERWVKMAQKLIWKPYFDKLARYFADGLPNETDKQLAKKLMPQLYARQ